METMEQTGCDLILFGQKTPQSLIQQGMEGSTTLGKDEVGSSNLPSSSKKASKTSVSMLFVAKMLKNVWVKMWVNRLTHTVTHTRKCADRFKEYRRGGFAPSPVFRILFLLTSLAP